MSWIDERPRAAFAAFAALHVVVWTALPSVLFFNLPLDLIEARTYGPEWQLGHDKLPPLPWWLAEIAYRLVGADFAFYLLSQLVVLASFALVWATALRIVGAAGALASVLIIDGLHYFNFTAPKFNHDVLQLPFWALAGWSFHAAIRRGRLRDWAWLGLALGLALWAKYFVVVLALPLAAFVLIDRQARRALRTGGPYVAIAVAVGVALPHLAWLIAQNFAPLAYAEARAAAGGALDHLTRPLLFVGGQILWLLPALLIALPLVRPRAGRMADPPDAVDRRIVALLAFGPAVLLIAAALLTGRRLIAMWGYPLWLFLGLWLVVAARPLIDRTRLQRVAATWGVVTALYGLAFIAHYGVLPYVDHRYRTSVFPGDRLAAEIAERFRAATGEPLRYVVADMWLGGNIHHYAPGQPRTLIDGRPARAPWIDLADLRAHGAAVVWTGEERASLPPQYAAIAAGAEVQPPFDLPMRFGNGRVPVGWAILRPAPRW